MRHRRETVPESYREIWTPLSIDEEIKGVIGVGRWLDH